MSIDVTGFASPGRLPIHAIRRQPDVLLDGEWRFQLRSSAADASDDWASVHVPSLWTMSSSVDRPYYTNVPMPFTEVPPQIPSHNPVGVYRRAVALRRDAGIRVVLHVGAAEGHLTVVVNGSAVGTSTDSHLEAEFDITDEIATGSNELELRVAKWSAVSYLEDQDQWWQSGLSRSVWISYVPDVRLADVVARAGWNAERQVGSLTLTVSTVGIAHLAHTGHSVRIDTVRDRHEVPVSGKVAAPTLPKPENERTERPEQLLPEDFMDMLSIAAASAPVPPEFRAIPNMAGMAMHGPASPAGTAVLELEGLDVQPWSAERPVLHPIVVSLLDAGGKVVDSATVHVGFRSVQIVGRDLLINGERVLIQGVARHDVDPRTGRVMSRDRYLKELSLLKRMNVNAIRTSHYPNDPVFLDLCDELGFYVIDEADVEGHAFASTIADDPTYLTPIVERVQRMVVRDRNHPCVIAWSLGNETGYGAAHDAAAAWLGRFDPTRPVHYEGAISTDWHGGHAATDIVCPMYPSFAALEAYASDAHADRPLILCEYAYSQGNSTGGLAEYWKLFETLPGLQGGFIWEFLDHALDPDGDGRYRYGGEFDDAGNNGATMLNGIAFADATPKPALYEARGLFSPVRVVSAAETALRGSIRVRSRRHFADLSDLTATVHVEHRDGAGPEHPLDLSDLQPATERTIALPTPVVDELHAADALALSLTLHTAADAAWAPAGTELAVEQVMLPRTAVALAAPVRAARATSDGTVEHAMLAAGPRLSLWRPLTDCDGSFALDRRFVRSGFFALTPTSVETDGATTVIRYATAWGDEVVHTRRLGETSSGYRFDEDVRLPEGTRDGLRVGVEFELSGDFAQASFVGLGPWENYSDRRSSALLGRWTSSIDDLAVPYLIPQENGTRGGVDTLELRGASGTVTVRSDVALYVNVARHTVAELEQATHWWQLPDSNRTIVHLDIAHRGVGTGLLGPDTRPIHRLFGDHYTWSWQLDLPST